MAKRSSEFGGVEGRIAPLPHPLNVYEETRLMRAIDPDPELPLDLAAGRVVKVDDVDAQRVLDAGKRGIGPVDKEGNL